MTSHQGLTVGIFKIKTFDLSLSVRSALSAIPNREGIVLNENC